MKITVDPSSLPSLLAFLAQRQDCVWTITDEGEVHAGLLGSYADGGDAELERRLAAWREDEKAGVKSPGRALIALPGRPSSRPRTPRR